MLSKPNLSLKIKLFMKLVFHITLPTNPIKGVLEKLIKRNPKRLNESYITT